MPDDLDLFERYEPRPKYKVAVKLTTQNLVAVAERINYLRGCAEDLVALVHPGSKLILQTHDGEEVGRAYPQDYIVRTQTGFAAIKGDDFGRSHRKCVGDDR